MRSADGRFEYLDRDSEPLPDGARFPDDVGRIRFRCRSYQGTCSVNCKSAGYPAANQNWELSGTPDAPTIRPSINCESCWHGYVTDGRYTDCAGVPEPRQ